MNKQKMRQKAKKIAKMKDPVEREAHIIGAMISAHLTAVQSCYNITRLIGGKEPDELLKYLTNLFHDAILDPDVLEKEIDKFLLFADEHKDDPDVEHGNIG
jgi:hypothetical protein